MNGTTGVTMVENGSHGDGQPHEYVFDNKTVQCLFLLIYSIVFFFCFFGNLTVLLVMTLHWKMRSMTKFCLGNLAFANLCVGIFCIYQNLSIYIIESWIFGKFMCKMYHFTNNLSHTASIIILVVISLERYFVIVHPFTYRSVITMKRLRLLILGIWLSSAIFCAPRLYYIDTIRNVISRAGRNGTEWICVLRANVYDYYTADLIQFVLLFLLPLLIITVLYSKVGLHLRRRGQQVVVHKTPLFNSSMEINSFGGPLSTVVTAASTGSCTVGVGGKAGGKAATITESEIDNFDDLFPSHELVVIASTNTGTTTDEGRSPVFPRAGAPAPISGTRGRAAKTIRTKCVRRGYSYGQRPHIKVLRMLIVHVITFTICNFPYYLRKLAQNFWVEADMDGYFMELATPLSFLLMYTNCAINPIVYAFMSVGFRNCFVEVITCSIGKRQSLSRNG